MRVLLFTGKGGVGKTSVAAATALRAAHRGYRTVVVSTDAAHSLGDSLDIPLSGEPRQVAENLWAQETDLTYALSTHWGTIQDWLSALLAWRGMDQRLASEVAILPGMEELANLLYILDYFEGGKYQTVIVDCAPTGETLRLLSFPEVLHWWIEHIMPWQRRAASLLRPLAKRLTDMPFPTDQVFNATQHLVTKLERLAAVLTDADKVSVRLVVNPEKMVIKEAQRTYTYLNLYGYATDLIVCNRVMPAEVGDAYFDAWKVQQGRYLKMIEEGFSPVPIRTIPFFPQEVVGLEMLGRMADALYGEEDPTRFYFHGQAQRLEKKDGYYLLSLRLPFTSRERVNLLQDGDEVVIQVGNFRRNLYLPRVLLGWSVAEARLEGELLLVRFEEGKSHGEAAGDKPEP